MDKKFLFSKPEVWGGLECTINRVGNNFRDQLHAAGHYIRGDDIEKIAALGMTTLCYPVLWEAHQPEKNTVIDFSRVSNQFDFLRNAHITPVAGLIHHGSGPAFTNLSDPHFAKYFAAYATKVATEFPWLEYYKPVNEPLTTARFSGLYGLWYPHHRNDLSFVNMFLNQLKATVLAMKAIRHINPSAKLVQTEDLAKIHSTPLLRYQADFENERRWSTFDLLCGRVNKDHPLWSYFQWIGIKEKSLTFFLDNPCPPDILGLNYYVTSERYLDEKIDDYPGCTPGGNGIHRYVDVEAVRVTEPAGLHQLLHETWARYHLPMVITEAHLNCTREEQMRWLKEIWDASVKARQEGVDIKAVTAWSMLGAYDWDSLLTENNGHYETGVFDCSAGILRPTVLATLIKTLAEKGDYTHPLLSQKGWWHQPGRLLKKITTAPSLPTLSRKEDRQPLMILGKNGPLGNAFAKLCDHRHIPYQALSRNDIDILQEIALEKVIALYKPWAIINATGYAGIEEAEINKEQCFRIHAQAPGLLAKLCRRHGIQLMTFSSDLVFDGEKRTPYTEQDSVKPLNVFGGSKAAGEEKVLTAFTGSLIIRTCPFFGPWDRSSFVYQVLESLRQQQSCFALKDVMLSPTYIPDLVHAALDLLIDEAKGIWHIANDTDISWADFACEIAKRGGHRKEDIIPAALADMEWKAKRPAYSVLKSNKGIILPALDHALSRYFAGKEN